MERCPSGVNARCAAQNKGPSGFRQFDDVLRGVAERDQRLPARQYDRIEEPLIPLHPLIVSSSKVGERPPFCLIQSANSSIAGELSPKKALNFDVACTSAIAASKSVISMS
jgi:hypothetical protein